MPDKPGTLLDLLWTDPTSTVNHLKQTKNVKKKKQEEKEKEREKIGNDDREKHA